MLEWIVWAFSLCSWLFIDRRYYLVQLEPIGNLFRIQMRIGGFTCVFCHFKCHLTVYVNCTRVFHPLSGCLFICDICSPYCWLTTDIIWCIWGGHLTGFLLSNCLIKMRMSSHGIFVVNCSIKIIASGRKQQMLIICWYFFYNNNQYRYRWL